MHPIHFGSIPASTFEVPEITQVERKGHELAEASHEALKRAGRSPHCRKPKLI